MYHSFWLHRQWRELLVFLVELVHSGYLRWNRLLDWHSPENLFHNTNNINFFITNPRSIMICNKNNINPQTDYEIYLSQFENIKKSSQLKRFLRKIVSFLLRKILLSQSERKEIKIETKRIWKLHATLDWLAQVKTNSGKKMCCSCGIESYISPGLSYCLNGRTFFLQQQPHTSIRYSKKKNTDFFSFFATNTGYICCHFSIHGQAIRCGRSFYKILTWWVCCSCASY